MMKQKESLPESNLFMGHDLNVIHRGGCLYYSCEIFKGMQTLGSISKRLIKKADGIQDVKTDVAIIKVLLKRTKRGH